MPQDKTTRLIKILKRTGAYLFLYVGFIYIFYYYAYRAWLYAKPIGLMMALLRSLGLLLLYSLVNHLLIKKTVGLKTVVIFESILLVIFYVLMTCYAAIENRSHGNFSDLIIRYIKTDYRILLLSLLFSGILLAITYKKSN